MLDCVHVSSVCGEDAVKCVESVLLLTNLDWGPAVQLFGDTMVLCTVLSTLGDCVQRKYVDLRRFIRYVIVCTKHILGL